MRLDAVRAHANHDRIDFAESREGVPKIARFLRAARGVVLGLEIEDDVLPREGIARDGCSVVCFEREVWSLIALGDGLGHAASI